MKFLKKDRRAYAAKASALKRLLGSGMLLEGSLTRSMRGGSEHCQLTDKADGRTRTLYVPAYGPRDEGKCLYMEDTVACTFLAATMLKCRSRNAVDGCRNTEAMASSMLDLAGQSWWPEGERKTTACTETLVYRMKEWDAEKVRVANAGLIRRLVNAKFFEEDRIMGRHYCVAVDAVHRDERRATPRGRA
jgi:hypothetical protein